MPKGKVSLLYYESFNLWEIYALAGVELDDDIERFKTKEKAEKRIEELLEETPSQTYHLPIEARDGDNI